VDDDYITNECERRGGGLAEVAQEIRKHAGSP
jgi:hypothetical protein